MSKIIIHRGTKEIGGSALEINNGDIRLLFDFGIPLESMEREDYDPAEYKLPIQGLYRDEKPQFNAVFLTHAHQDHYGLMQLINSDIPIYMSKVTFDILKKITPLISDEDSCNLNLKIIDDEINFGNIRVKAHRVDHSVAGALAYEVKVDGKTIVYTGDLRFHGRASWQSSVLKRKIKTPDYLIMEGTTLGRTEQNAVKEEDLEEDFIKIFEGDKLPLVQLSSQNLDRFVTVYKACVKARKTLVIDPYTCCVLEVYAQISKSIPQFSWNNIGVYFANKKIREKLAETKELFKFKSKKITQEEILANPQKYVIKGNGTINRIILDNIDREKLSIVYSMWKGYLEKPSQFDNYKDILTCLHVSGHAYIKDLQDFVDEVKPKNLIPIHTECKDKYKELFNANIVELEDGQVLSL